MDQLYAELEDKYRLPRGTLRAVRQQESGGDPNALSPKGAAGLMQIMPETAKNPGYGVKPLQGWDGVDPRTAPPEEQMRFGAEYLAAMSNKFGGDMGKTLAAYNAGPGAVEESGGIPNYKETQDYVNNITANIKKEPESKKAKIPDGFEIIEDNADSGAVPDGFEIIEDDPLKQGLGMARQAADLAAAYAGGRTFGFGPKIAAGIGTAVAYPVVAGIEAMQGDAVPSFGDLYEKSARMYQQPERRAYEENPLLATAAGIAGGVKTGLQFGGTKAGKGISDWANVPKSGGPLTQRALNLLQRSAKSGLVGEAGYRAYKVGAADPGKEAEELVSGIPLGGIVGGAAPVIGGAISKGANLLTPKVDEAIKPVASLAEKYKIPLSVDQLTSSRPIKNIQKLSQELPFSGVGKFKDAQMSAFNRALTKTFGKESEKITPEVMDSAFTNLGKQFDDLGRGKVFDIGENFSSYVKSVMDDAPAYSDDAVNKFKQQVDVVYKNAKDGKITGEALGFLRNRINRLARKASDADTKELFRDLENGIIDIMTAGDDAAKDAFSKTKQQYKNLLVVEPLASKAKAGNINPTELQRRAAKVYGRAYTTGKAGDIGDLARIGNELLPTPGGSDTAQKLLFAGGATYFEPSATITTLGLNKAYQSWFNQNQNVIKNILEDEFLKIARSPGSEIAGGGAAAALPDSVKRQPTKITVRPSDAR